MKLIIALIVLWLLIKLFGFVVLLFWALGGIFVILGIAHMILKSMGCEKGLFS